MRTWKIGLAATTAVAAVVVISVILFHDKPIIGGSAGAATPNPAMMAMPVPVTKILKQSVPIYLEYSARTESIRSVALQAKASGFVQQQHVPDGTDVREGDLLYSIDPRDYQAALDQAKAQLQRRGGAQLCAG